MPKDKYLFEEITREFARLRQNSGLFNLTPKQEDLIGRVRKLEADRDRLQEQYDRLAAKLQTKLF